MTLMAHVSTFIDHDQTIKARRFQLTFRVLSYLSAQGPFCWTNLWNGCVRSAVKSAEASSQTSFKMKTQSENFCHSTTKTPRTYFLMHSTKTKKFISQFNNNTTPSTISFLSHANKYLCLFHVYFFMHIRFVF